MSRNPNEYNDNAWLSASNELRSQMTVLLRGLWEAGAEISEIQLEVNEGMNEALIDIGAVDAPAHRHGGAKKKKPEPDALGGLPPSQPKEDKEQND